MDILQCDRFWADVPLADGVFLVTPDGFDLSILELDFKTADGLAKVACYVVCLIGVCVFHYYPETFLAYLRQQTIDYVFTTGKITRAKQVEMIQHVIEIVQVSSQGVAIG